MLTLSSFFPPFRAQLRRGLLTALAVFFGVFAAHAQSRLVNLSSRAVVGTGDNVLIGGFIIPTGASKTVYVRAAGPTLSAFSVSGALTNPQITVYNGSGVAVASNDDWDSSTGALNSTLAGFSFTSGSKDAALSTTLAPGAYTVVVSGVSSTTGVALVEIYETDTANTLVNLSTRAQVGTGDSVLIVGFVVGSGNSSKTLLIRGVGPTLSSYGVSGVLSDPKLTLYNSSGTAVAENDNWGTPLTASDASASTLASMMSAANLFSFTSGSKDAALLVSLAPGAYTAVVSGVSGSTGVALAEIYDVTGVTVSGTVTAPSILTQPSSITVSAGAGASFTVAASGTAPLTYQWYKDGTAISGATSATYSIASASTSNAGSYYAVVTNSAGSAMSTTATLTVSTTASGTLSASVYTAAQAFLDTLSSSQKTTAQVAWSLATGRKWSNLPAAMVARNGVSWSSLSTAQKTAATTLISTALSSTGLKLWTDLQAADDYLAASGGGSSYGAGSYYIAILGTPSTSGFWVLQLTGHHLTYNINFNGTYKTPTPLFLGVEPKAPFTLNGTSYDPMLSQRSAVGALVAVLPNYSGSQLSGTYSDILFGANGSGSIDGTYPKSYPSGTSGRGVLFTSLSTADQEKVKDVIRSYVNTQATEYANDLLSAYLSDSALAQTYVAYAGTAGVTTRNSYIRVDGPRVWIEFSVQNGVIFSSDIHFHTIWRDKNGDYGGMF